MIALPPPLLWQQFESLTRDTASIIYDDPNATAFGNQGAAQNGVDVYCEERSSNRLIGIQCKRLGKLDANGNALAGGLKVKHLTTEINNAEAFTPALDHYVIATTDARRTAIQRRALEISRQRKQAGKFTVGVMFWEDFLGHLHNHATLMQWYYTNILNLSGLYNLDNQILSLCQTAFSRPAFSTKLDDEEGITDLLDALKDTKKALNTGRLQDREAKHLLRVAPGGIGLISDHSWVQSLQDVVALVSEAEKECRKAFSADKFVQLSKRIEVRDTSVAKKIDKLRGDAVRELNKVLAAAGLNEVETNL